MFSIPPQVLSAPIEKDIMSKFKDIAGLKFDRLLALEYSHKDDHYRSFWKCRCDCGQEITVRLDGLTSGHAKSCGCLRKERALEAALKDITNERFGRLVALEYAGSNKQNTALWKCQCDCGQTKVVVGSSLRDGSTQSCGCLHRDAVTKHGLSHTAEYRAYLHAKNRCNNPTNHAYADYGGRGIKCLLTSFKQFINHIGTKPSPDLELDRINNDGHYEVGNVRWATREQQQNNKRPRSEWKSAKDLAVAA
jgi:hypothetical protein